jgi:hypothetical protein
MICRCKSIILGTIGTLAGLALILAIIALVISGMNNGIQAVLVGAGGGTIPDGDNVLFDTVVNDQSGSISYNPATGEFTVTRLGNYYVDWWTAPDGAGPATSISFAVAVDGVVQSTASSPIVSAQMAASALVTIDTVPATISLVNVTGQDVFVPTIPAQAGIVITR